MIGLFYNKNTLNNTLVISISEETEVSSKKTNKFYVAYDANNKPIFINILNFNDDYKDGKTGFLQLTDKIANTINSITGIDLEYAINQCDFVVGKVTKCSNIDNSHLHLCEVDIKSELLQIICGAPNVKKDQLVVVAKVGAILPNGLKIKSGKILGHNSFGMLCSSKELDLNANGFNLDGIISLSETFVTGEELSKVIFK